MTATEHDVELGGRDRVVDWPRALFRVPLAGEREVRLQRAAWADLLSVIAHLELVGRVMWPGCADVWVHDTLRRWIGTIDADAARALGDALLCEVDLRPCRARRASGEVSP